MDFTDFLRSQDCEARFLDLSFLKRWQKADSFDRGVATSHDLAVRPDRLTCGTGAGGQLSSRGLGARQQGVRFERS